MAIVMKIRYKNSGDTKPEHSIAVCRRVIDYCMQTYKTEIDNHMYAVSGQNCTPELAFEQFRATKMAWNKTEGVYFRHYIQSFPKGDKDVSPELAHDIAREFAAKVWDGYEVLIATHVDKGHVHSHFVINTVRPDNGKKLHEDRNYLQGLRKVSDEICVKHGLSVLKPYTKNEKSSTMKNREYRSAYKGDSWKLRLRMAISTAMEWSYDRESFIENMNRLGYDVRWEDNRQHLTYTCWREPKFKDGSYRKCRDNKLNDKKYTKGNITNELAIRQSFINQRASAEAERSGSNTDARADRNDHRDGMAEAFERGQRYDSPCRRDEARAEADADTRRRVSDRDEETRRRTAEGADEGFDRAGEEYQGHDPTDGDGVHGTGWESERESFKKHFTQDPYGRCPVGSSPSAHGPADTSRVGSLGLYGLASAVSIMDSDDSDKTPEEIKAEVNAKIAEQNMAAIAAMAALGVEYLIKKSKKDSAPDGNNDNEADEDYGFEMTM